MTTTAEAASMRRELVESGAVVAHADFMRVVGSAAGLGVRKLAALTSELEDAVRLFGKPWMRIVGDEEIEEALRKCDF